jgi:hypothetical protein
MSFLRSKDFWLPFTVTAVITGLFFAWEADAFMPYIPGPIRPPLTTEELIFTLLILLLLSLDVGLYAWRKRHGSCPVGSRRATGVGAALGALTLLCPACTLIPIALLGTSITLGFLSPFLPLLRVVTVVILVAVAGILWPRRRS